MLSRKFRLPLTRSAAVYKKEASSTHFLVKAAPNNKEQNRYAIIIPKSSAKKSVRRHFWKRRVAEQLISWPNTSKDFLIIVLPGVERAREETLKDELNRIRSNLKPNTKRPTQ